MRETTAVRRLFGALCFAKIVQFDAQLRYKISLHHLDILLAISKSVKISLSEIVNAITGQP